ncbi:MAG: hypothetical protein ACTSVB_11600 [Candidatus Heimdallarchaeaceae archaeon]
MHTIKIIAHNTFGNSNEMKISIKAVSESSSSDDTNETTSQDKQTLNLPFNFWRLFIALLIITIITKKLKKLKT